MRKSAWTPTERLGADRAGLGAIEANRARVCAIRPAWGKNRKEWTIWRAVSGSPAPALSVSHSTSNRGVGQEGAT